VAALRDRLRNALNESRILVLVGQVILGFQFQSVFQPEFESLPAGVRAVQLVTFFGMIASLLLLLYPAARHRIVEQGQNTTALHRETTLVLCVALAPFALALGAGIQMAAARSLSGSGWMLGAAAAVLSSLLWYGWGWFRSPSLEASQETPSDEESETPLKDRIEEVLMEARMVLPGAQALLGFQVTITLMNAFEGLDQALKDVHLAALGMTSLSLMLLIAPAAYHRIVERGHNSEEFDRIAGRLLLAAMATLAVGLSCDVVVVVSRVTGSRAAGIGTGAFVLVAAWGLWFGLTSWKAATRKS
jgi:hypothetical protein